MVPASHASSCWPPRCHLSLHRPAPTAAGHRSIPRRNRPRHAGPARWARFPPGSRPARRLALDEADEGHRASDATGSQCRSVGPAFSRPCADHRLWPRAAEPGRATMRRGVAAAGREIPDGFTPPSSTGRKIMAAARAGMQRHGGRYALGRELALRAGAVARAACWETQDEHSNSANALVPDRRCGHVRGGPVGD